MNYITEKFAREKLPAILGKMDTEDLIASIESAEKEIDAYLETKNISTPVNQTYVNEVFKMGVAYWTASIVYFAFVLNPEMAGAYKKKALENIQSWLDSYPFPAGEEPSDLAKPEIKNFEDVMGEIDWLDPDEI